MGCLEKLRQIWDWICVSHSCRRQGPVAPGTSTAGTGGADGASRHWFVKEGSTTDGNHDETVRAPAGSHSTLRDAKHEGQDWAHTGGSKGDKMPMNNGRSCHRAAPPANAAREPSLCSQVGGSPGQPRTVLASPAAIPGARRGTGSFRGWRAPSRGSGPALPRRRAELSPPVTAARCPGKEGQTSRRTRGPQSR